MAPEFGHLLEAVLKPTEAVCRDGLARFQADPAFATRLQAHAACFSRAATARGYAAVYAGILGKEWCKERLATAISSTRSCC